MPTHDTRLYVASMAAFASLVCHAAAIVDASVVLLLTAKLCALVCLGAVWPLLMPHRMASTGCPE
jgi:hypothetical protein